MIDVYTIYTYFRTTFTRRDVLLILGLMALYFITRLIQIENFPIFSDEGIYINWAKIAWKDAAWRFISLTDGRQPLQTWGTIPFLKIAGYDNALLGGRLFAVATGFMALAGVYTLLFTLFSKRAAAIGALLYIITPYFLFYDRMALMDSGVNAFFIWMMIGSILLARHQRLDIALVLGLVAGVGTLAKSTMRMFFVTALAGPILFFTTKWKKFSRNAVNYYALFAVSALVSFAIYNVQRLSQFFHYVGQKNYTFVMSPSEFLANPVEYLFRNLQILPLYITWEMAFVVPVLGILGFILLYQKDRRLFWYLVTWFIIPFGIVAVFAKVLFPRYVIYLGTILLITASYYISQLDRKKFLPVLALIVLSVAYPLYTIWFDHTRIPFPPVDRGQYLEGWTAGWGAKEIMDYAREQSQEKPVLILAEGTFGMSGDVLQVFKHLDDDIEIKGFWPMAQEHIDKHRSQVGEKHVFVVLSHDTDEPDWNWRLEKIQTYDRPGDEAQMGIYRVQPAE